MTRRRGWLLALVAALVLAPGLEAYLKLGTRVGNRVVSIQWNRMPIRYFVTNRDTAGVTAPQLQTAVARAFNTWAGVEGLQITSQFVGFTGAEPSSDDGVTVVGFQSRPELERTLAAATFEVDGLTGEILASDIFFNTAFAWSVAASGEPSRFDVESIALHEVGHLLGLGHSALGETEVLANGRRRVLGKASVMFPLAYPSGTILDRTLRPDDRAGILDIYAGSDASRRLGAISGQVMLGSAGVFGAHVTAFNPATGELVSGFALSQQGDFVITGLTPGMYVVRVEPLDDGDTDSFFDESTTVNLNFRPTYHPRLVSVPAGGAGASITVRVSSR